MQFIVERFKRSFLSLSIRFWIREYIISILIISGISIYAYYYHTSLFSLTFFFLINALLFPFSKYVLIQIKKWWYLFVYQVDSSTIYRPIGLLILIVKVFKNMVLFIFSFIIGILGLILLILMAPKCEVK